MNWKTKSGVTAALLMMSSCFLATPAFADVHIQVHRGDTMWSIAQHFGVSVKALRLANSGVNPSDMQIGTVLHIPTNGGGTKSHPSAQRNPDLATHVTYRKASLPDASAAGKLAAVLATAHTLMGVHYTWGGDTPATGFDCSGFTQYVFSKNGISLPRTATQQAGVGVLVPRDDLQPGDLLFFTDTYTNHYANQVTHVGIYAGDGNMIESSSVHNQGVMVIKNVFANPYYQTRYYGAKNVTG
ncbi:peptidoglycan endopeptidase [Alicyclobacillaceae bacterium I2511]|jgi:LysM repeat protein|nr:peptidoglycan endopeptidase [Alicyclobacillaceae bacterium I2511]